MIVSLTTVASQPHAPVQLGLSVVRTTLASPCGSGDSALPGTAYRVAMRNPPRFPDGGLPGTESTRLEGLRPTVLRTDKAVRVRQDAWRRSRPLDGYFQYPAIGTFCTRQSLHSDTDLRIGQVATGVAAEPGAGGGLGARAQVAVADREEAARLAAIRQMGLPVAQDRQARVGRVRPDAAERLLAHVAAVVVPAKLVVVDIAERVYGRDVAAGTVAARSFEPPPHGFGPFRGGLLQMQQHIGGVRMVVHRQHLQRLPRLVTGPRPREDAIHDGAGRLRGQVHLLHPAAAPRIGQVIDAEALDIVFEA